MTPHAELHHHSVRFYPVNNLSFPQVKDHFRVKNTPCWSFLLSWLLLYRGSHCGGSAAEDAFEGEKKPHETVNGAWS